eukprot:s305_g13.t1
MTRDDKVCFIDPIRFPSLLGATKDVIVALPAKASIAFRGLADATAVPHALLALQIALVACRFDSRPIAKTVQMCWSERISPAKVLVLRNHHDYLFMVTKDTFQKCLLTHCVPKWSPGNLKCVFSCFAISRLTCMVQEGMTLLQFAEMIGIESPARQGLQIGTSDSCLTWEVLICTVLEQVISIVFEADVVLSFRFFSECQPTAPLSVSSQSTEVDEQTLLRDVEMIENELSDLIHYKVFVAGHDKQFAVCWPESLSVIQISTKLSFLLNLPDSMRVISWFEVLFHFEEPNTRVLIADPASLCGSQRKAIVICCKTYEKYTCPVVPALVVPANLALSSDPFNRDSFRINGNPIDPFVAKHVQNGDWIDFELYEKSTSKRKCPAVVPEHVISDLQDRTNIMIQHGPNLGSDEFQTFLAFLRAASTRPIVSNIVHCDRAVLTKAVCDLIREVVADVIAQHSCGCIPLFFDKHWAAIEVEWNEWAGSVRLHMLNVNPALVDVLALNFMQIFSAMQTQYEIKSWVIPVKQGFCGWALVHRWMQRFYPNWTPLSVNFPFTMDGVAGPKGFDKIPDSLWQHILESLNVTPDFRQEDVRLHVTKTALWARCVFFQCFQKMAADVIFGAGEQEDADMPGAGEGDKVPDPLSKEDPWAKWGGKIPKQCKWDELVLPDDHSFFDSQEQRLMQVHHFQLNSQNSGVAFCTKSTVQSVVNRNPKTPYALLIPASERLTFDPSLKLTTSGPVEVVVRDASTNAIYKRQVLIVQQGDAVKFSLPKPTYKATLTVLKEMVLEVNTALISKDQAAMLIEKPLLFIQSKSLEQFPVSIMQATHLYGVRILRAHGNRDHVIAVQAMCKVSESARKTILERSGASEIFTRDFVPKGESVQDVTVLPRFWTIDRAGKDSALKSAASLKGYAGLAVVKRGIAARSWCAQIAEMRKVLLAEDDRITATNIHVVPKFSFESTGWPLSIGAKDVVDAVKFACQLPAIPTKCYRSLGVTSWSLAFETRPKVLKFTAMFNSVIHEILLTEQDQTIVKLKPNRIDKGKGKGANPSMPAPKAFKNNSIDEATNQRLTSLETKFSSMERRQDVLENKLTSNFDSIQNQLRQVLQAVQPRANSPAPTGMTPPTKAPKTS